MLLSCQRLFILIFTGIVPNTVIVGIEECGHPYDSKPITGRRRPANRIVNGTDVTVWEVINGAPIHNYPWMVRIGSRKNSDRNYCGGSLISRKHVLTAAHCMCQCKRKGICKIKDNCTKDEIQCIISANMKWVTLGDHDIRTNNAGEVFAEVKRTFCHPKTSQPNPPKGIFIYDFSVVELSQCVRLQPNIRIVCLPEYDMNTYTEEQVNVIGWGHLDYEERNNRFAGKYSNILQEITINVISNAVCAKEMADLKYLYDSEYLMCAGDPIQWRKDACMSDSGGPLLYQQNDTKRWVVLGVVSFGYECATPEKPGYYARVSRVVPWIRSILRESPPCQHEEMTQNSFESTREFTSPQSICSDYSGSTIPSSTVSNTASDIMFRSLSKFRIAYHILMALIVVQSSI